MIWDFLEGTPASIFKIVLRVLITQCHNQMLLSK